MKIPSCTIAVAFAEVSVILEKVIDRMDFSKGLVLWRRAVVLTPSTDSEELPCQMLFVEGMKTQWLTGISNYSKQKY